MNRLFLNPNNPINTRPIMNHPEFPVKPALKCLFRIGHHALLLLGLAALLLGALQFTNLPWLAYKRLADVPHPSPREPTIQR